MTNISNTERPVDSEVVAKLASESRNATKAMLVEFWYYFSQNRGAVIGLAVFALLVIVAIFAPLLAPHNPDMQYRDSFLAPPFWEEGGKTAFLLGTDAVGRDMLSRLMYGARYSLFIGIVVVTIALVRRYFSRRHRGLFPRRGRYADHAGDGYHPRLSFLAAWRWCWWRSWGRASPTR